MENEDVKYNETKDHNEEVINGKKTHITNCLSCIPARVVLYLLFLTAMISSFFMRSVMPITILAMVKSQPQIQQNTTFTSKTCLEKVSNSTITNDYKGTLDWSLTVQYYIITSFYWTYIIAQVLGGIASQKFGTKIVVGYALLVSSLCNICVPFASGAHYVLVVILQIVHGLGQGLVWPALYGLVSVWIPVYERSRFLTSFQGMSVGTAIGQVMAGYVIARLGWNYVFFIVGGVGLLWTLAWYLLAFDTPESHPRISPKELEYIKENRGSIYKKSYGKIPWKSIILSPPVWAIAITSFGRMWLTLTISLYGPLYLKTVIGLNVEDNGLWSGIPSGLALFSSYLFSYIAEKLLTKNYISIINSRKLFSGISQVIPGILSICFGYLNCNIHLVLLFWCSIQLIHTACYSGSMVNPLDIAPHFTGPSFGFIQIFLMLPSIFSSLFAKTLLQNESSLETWKTIFIVAGVIDIVSYAFFFKFASAKVQKWDMQHTKEIAKEEDTFIK